MSQKYIHRIRKRAFHAQQGRCYYCRARMWLSEPSSFLRRHRISKADARRFQCTAEHLVARQDRGADTPSNIVAACWFCNNNRHQAKNPLDHDRYLEKVRKRLRRTKWHHPHLRHVLNE